MGERRSAQVLGQECQQEHRALAGDGDAVALHQLARACPQVRLVPVWIENLKRVLPKGKLVPIPLACTVRYGAPLVLAEGEDKNAFIARARAAMLDLRPEYDKAEDARA